MFVSGVNVLGFHFRRSFRFTSTANRRARKIVLQDKLFYVDLAARHENRRVRIAACAEKIAACVRRNHQRDQDSGYDC